MKKLITAFLTLAVVAMCFTGCGKEKEKGKEKDEESTSTHTESSSDTQQDSRAVKWFEAKVEEYIESKYDKDFKVYVDVEEVLDGAKEDEILKFATASISIYCDAKDITKEQASDFSDGFAREFAGMGALGNINCSTYVTPSEVYAQVEESNHQQVEEKAMLMDDYNKYSFSYTGLSDAMDSKK